MEAKQNLGPINWPKLILIMVAVTFLCGLTMGIVQHVFNITFPAGALGAGIGAFGGLLLGSKYARKPMP